MSTDGVDGAGDGGNSGDSDNSEPSLSEESRDSLDNGGHSNTTANNEDNSDAAQSDAGADMHGYDEAGIDVPASDPHEPTAAEREASQERMAAEAQSAKQAYEACEAQPQTDQTYEEALDQEVAAQNAAAIAADRIEAHTTSKNQRGGQPAIETIHEDRIAADIVHMAQTDPVGAKAVYDAAQRQLGDQSAEMQSAIEAELTRDRLASDALLGDADFQAQDPAEITREAARLVEDHTSTFGTRAGTTREVFDVNSMSYEIEQMALENPSKAAAVRAELAAELTPAQASDMNRMIAGDATWEENLAIGFENPVDGVVGIGKGMVNGVSDVVELAGKGLAYKEALEGRVMAEMAGVVGLDGAAGYFNGLSQTNLDIAANLDVPEFDLKNRAQEGGAVAGAIIDVALAGKGLVTGAAKLAARNVDDVAQAASRLNDDLTWAGGRGTTSGRPFDPEQAGGPIEDLDWRSAEINPRGLADVKTHLNRFETDPANTAMIDRLEAIERGDLAATDYDLRFYTHETRELERYRNLGVADDVDPGYDVWNNAHTATLEDYGLKDFDEVEGALLYHPSALE